jgi:hypothetical protein
MGRAYRLAGAILAESRGEFFLVGNTKEPCDFPAHGFETPVEIDAMKRPFVRLARAGEPKPSGGPWLELDTDCEAFARVLAERFLIERNGSVSDRLWRLVLGGGDPDAELPKGGSVDARWLGQMPQPVWNIVRETVLRCV